MNCTDVMCIEPRFHSCFQAVTGYTNELLKLLQINIYGLLDVLRQCAAKTADVMHVNNVSLVDRAANLTQIFSALARSVRMTLVNSPSPAGSGEHGDLRTLDCLLAVLEAAPPVGCRVNALHTFYALQSLADDAARVGSLSEMRCYLCIAAIK